FHLKLHHLLDQFHYLDLGVNQVTSKRIDNHPVLGKLADQEKVTFQFDGKKYEGYENDTIASALLANGVRTLRKHENTANPRGIYCNIGHSLDCGVTVNNEWNVRARLIRIQDNMNIARGKPQAHPLHPDNDTDAIRTYEDFKHREEELTHEENGCCYYWGWAGRSFSSY